MVRLRHASLPRNSTGNLARSHNDLATKLYVIYWPIIDGRVGGATLPAAVGRFAT